MTLRAAPARPTVRRLAPAYPRLLALGALLVAGCGGVIDKDGTSADPSPVAQQKNDAGGETTTEPVSAGGAPFPYETGPAEDTAPPPPPPPPIDAAPAETEPPSAGGEPFPFDDAGVPEDAGPAPSP